MLEPGPENISRRAFVAATSGLLAGFGFGAGLPAQPGRAAPAARTAAPARTDLARYRPVRASSTAYAATPPQFAVDRLAVPGVRGSGWRAAKGDPQWIVVDLQARCRVDRVRLVFEGTAGDPAFDDSGANPWSPTKGSEILSSAAADFRVDVSGDGKAWRTVHQVTGGRGGVVDIALPAAVNARWVRLVVTRRTNANPLGLNGFQVYGTCDRPRPAATGWTSWEKRPDAPPALTVAADGTVPLESGWRLTLDDWVGRADGAALSRPAVDTAGWLPATVPGTVLGSLVEQGHLPDPVNGMNNLEIPEALSRHSWWYRRAFRVPRGLATGADRHVWLEFDGINHKAEVWLNGVPVGSLTHPFARAAFDVSAALKAGKSTHALAVKVTPMPHPGSPGDKGDSGQAFVQSANLYLDSPTLLAASGWDWMPAVRDRAAGIWNHVRLRSTGDAVIGDPRVESKLPKLPDTSVAEVTITVPVRNVGSVDRAVAVRAAFGKVTVSQTVMVKAGKQANVTFAPAQHPALRLTKPKLWWPNGYGDPDLHELAITASLGSAVSDRRTVRFGIRQFGYSFDIPIKIDPNTNSASQTVDIPAQSSRYLRIQCGRRATGWGDSLWTLSVVDSRNPDVDLALRSTATASSSDGPGNPASNAVDGNPRTRWSSQYRDGEWIQVDMGRTVGFDRVVLVWETAYALDFVVQVSADGNAWTDVKPVSNAPVPLQISVNGVRVFCRGGNWGWDELLRRMPPSRMKAVIGMHRDMNFTMIRNWIGSSNREEFFAVCDENGILVWNDFWEAGPFLENPPGYVDIARDTILRYRTHPCIVIWCGANEQHPPPVIDKGIGDAVREEDGEILYLPDSAAGFVSGHGPYYWVEPAKYFDKNTYDTFNFGFHTEIGIPTIPVVESMRNLVGEGDPGWPIGTPWYHHDWSTHGNQRPHTYLTAIDDRLGPSGGLAEFCRKAQFVNYENMRAMFEAWNAHLWEDASALLLWMSHPAWHSTVWQTYDYDMDVNGSYYGARKGCEPLHVQANQPDWRVMAINHTSAKVTGASVTAELFDLDGERLGRPRRQSVTVAPSATAPAFVVPFTDALPDLHLLRLKLVGADGTLLSENTYWRYRTPNDLQGLNRLGRPRLSVGTKPAGDGVLTATVRNNGRTVAAMLRLSLRDKRTGRRVLPAHYSDNYLWLLPGESRTVTVAAGPGAPKAQALKLIVDGYNASGTG
jgi:Exo-beta-D-glucosaminidase Ig-fold domain/F5/8 type C domain/Glycosyl hydrolases family 2/Glycosyl hydrolases family 2, sugar binding domain